MNKSVWIAIAVVVLIGVGIGVVIMLNNKPPDPRIDRLSDLRTWGDYRHADERVIKAKQRFMKTVEPLIVHKQKIDAAKLRKDYDDLKSAVDSARTHKPTTKSAPSPTVEKMLQAFDQAWKADEAIVNDELSKLVKLVESGAGKVPSDLEVSLANEVLKSAEKKEKDSRAGLPEAMLAGQAEYNQLYTEVFGSSKK